MYAFVKCVDLEYGPRVPDPHWILDHPLRLTRDGHRAKVMSISRLGDGYACIGYTDLDESLLNKELRIVGLEPEQNYLLIKVLQPS